MKIINGQKRCTQCFQMKALDEFRLRGKDRLNSWCKPCENKKWMEYHRRWKGHDTPFKGPKIISGTLPFNPNRIFKGQAGGPGVRIHINSDLDAQPRRKTHGNP